MFAKKNFCSFGFSAKFGSVDSVLHSLSKYSALVCVLLSCLNLGTNLFLENFTRESVSVSHQNFFLSLVGTLLNGRSGWLFGSEDV
jgi:hypothetical protein